MMNPVTESEIVKLHSALADPEFRRLLVRLAEDVNHPESKRIYRDEVAQMERERGFDVTFVEVKPGFVVKTTNLRTDEKVRKRSQRNAMIHD